jgi:DNA-binding PadR family transcriptional regulator
MKLMTSNHPINNQLLDEMRIGPRSPLELAGILDRDGLDVSVGDVVDRLESMEEDGLVRGPGISKLHHLGVELTARGRARLRELQVRGTRFGVWVRMN